MTKDQKLKLLAEVMETVQSSFLMIGRLLLKVRRTKAWDVQFKSFGEYFKDFENRCGLGQRQLYEYMRVAKELDPRIPEKEIIQMGTARAILLAENTRHPKFEEIKKLSLCPQKTIREIRETYDLDFGRPLIPVAEGRYDKVYTPDSLAREIVQHFKSRIKGSVYEPFAGKGAFLRAFAKNGVKKVSSTEIDDGTDFFEVQSKVDWIITSPPFSQMREVLTHCYELADNVVLLVPVVHLLGLRARVEDMMDSADFYLAEVVRCDHPKTWPPSGFQVAICYLKRGKGTTKWSDIRLKRTIERAA